MARSNRGKTTTDFGACRDLNGRRLRHVNNEIMLKKWAESQDEGEEKYDSEGKRESGVANWFLQVPSWARINQGQPSKDQKHTLYKTQICPHWLEARKWRDPPPRAPHWWGCPKGFDCDFAHGEGELVKEGREKLAKEREETRLTEKKVEEEEYMAGGVFGSDMEEIVMSGMRKRKREQAFNQEEDHKDDLEEKEEEGGSESPNWGYTMSGSVKWGEEGRVGGRGPFSSVGVGESVMERGRSGVREGVWFYEVEVITAGLMQIGWASPFFQPSEESGDGVGDDLHSFSFDGFRQLK